MTTPWRKSLRDLWRDRTRSAMVMLAIALGLASFLAVLSTYSVLRREIRRSYLDTSPASAVLLTDAIDDALLASAIAREDVEDADARRLVTGRIRNSAGVSRRFVFFVIRDFSQLRISTITPEEGEWPPADGGVLIERDAFQVVQAGIGDSVSIQTSAGRATTLRISGRVHDAGQAQARMENLVYGYITPATAALLGEPAQPNRLLLLASGDRFDKGRVIRIAADVRAWLEAGGHPVRRMDVPEPGEHPHAAIMGILLLAISAFGLLTLALSGVIVANLLLAMLAAERRQIGVMQAIGGTRRQIAAIYLAEAALFGTAAIVVATPAGIIGGRALSRYLGVLLNFDLASLAVPVWVYLLVAVVGLLVPLAAAAWPVARATRITVREALAVTGIDPATFSPARLTRLITQLFPSPLITLGVRNLFRRPARTLLTLGTLSAAGAAFISAINVRASLIATADRLYGAGTFGALSRYALDQHMLMIYVFLLIVAGILAGVGGLGLVTATSLNVLERRRELGVLRAIGATPARVTVIVVIEGVVIALLSWFLAEAVASAITLGLARLFGVAFLRGGLDVQMPLTGAFGWLAIALVLTTLASIAPAVQASRRSVREAVTYE